MVVIGLTGGIGSGKSAVASRIRGAGVPVIDADLVAREVVEPGAPALAKIAQAFGAHLIDEHGELRRKELGSIVFSDPEKLATLNQITHPAILIKTRERLAELRTLGHRWVIYEAALILENGLNPGLEKLIVVVCDPHTQLRRIMERDQLDHGAAEARMKAQTINERRREGSDYILENDEDLTALHDRVDALLERLSQVYGAPLSDRGQDAI